MKVIERNINVNDLLQEVKTCLERLDLENYDRCRELKSPFKRKQRLILIKSHKPGNKVSLE